MKTPSVASAKGGPISAALSEPTGKVVSFGRHTNGRDNEVPARQPTSPVTAIANRQMAAMEHDFNAAETSTGQVDALATLRLWRCDPRLDHGSRRRANALVWKLQPNGWDEV